MKRILIAICFILSILTGFVFSQEFGDISDQELEMVSITEDPEANYVILIDKAEIIITPDFELNTKVHKRFKILTEAGKDAANINIKYWHEDNIFELEAYAYSPDGEEFELDDDNIFDERVKNIRNKKFAIPGVEVGSVIEYKYEIISKYIYRLEPWSFQSSGFTKLSEISVLLPNGFSYSSLQRNWLNYDIQKNENKVWDPYHSGKRIKKFTWTARNMPAIKKEPYMTAFKDYYAQILFQLVSFKNQYFSRTFAKSWTDIAETYYNRFDEKIDSDDGHSELVSKITAGISNPMEKAKALFNYVRSEFETESGGGWFPDAELEEMLEKKKAKDSAKNVLLINFLNHAGFKAQPLLISTRNNGRIVNEWCQLQQFDRTIAYLKINNKKIFLDTSNEFCPFGYLTPSSDVGVGLLMSAESAKIIQINPFISKNRTEILTKLDMLENGSLIAETEITFKDYRAVQERNKLNDSKDIEQMVKNKVDDFNVDAQLDTFFYIDRDSIDSPLKLVLKYSLPDYFEETDSLIYFSLPFISGLSENPYVKETRNFPIDYSFPFFSKEVISLKIPDHCTIIEKPAIQKAKMKKVNYSRVFFTNNKIIECQRVFEIGRKRFLSKEYPELKSKFDQIIEADQELVVLGKSKIM